MTPETVATTAAEQTPTGVFVMASIVYGAFFAWLAIAGWAKQRRKERDAYYRNELERQLVEKGDLTTEKIVALRAQERREQWTRRREGLKLGGLATTAAGIGMYVGLQSIGDGKVHQIGWIPFSIGVVVLAYALTTRPPE